MKKIENSAKQRKQRIMQKKKKRKQTIMQRNREIDNNGKNGNR